MKKNTLIYLILLILIIWVAALSFKQPTTIANKTIEEVTVEGFSTDLTKTVEQHRSEVVSVVTDESIQSGLVYSQNEDTVYVLTCYHGLSGADSITVMFGDTYERNGKLIGLDIYTDLAVLAVETPYEIKGVTLGDASLLKPGEFVLSIGSPVSLEYIGSSELGIISKAHIMLDNSISYNSEMRNYYLDVIPFTSNIRNGYSGSPLFNMDGQLVGVSTMSNSSTKFAITANEAKIVADRIIAGNDVNRNNLGISVVYVKDLYNYEKSNMGISIDSTEGLYVKDVRDSSFMAKADIHKGDIILKANDIELNSFDAFLNLLYLDANEITLTYIRDGVTYTVTQGNLND